MRCCVIATPSTVDKHQRFVGSTSCSLSEAIIAAVVKLFGIHLVTLGGAHPAFFRQHHGDGVVGEQIFIGVGAGFHIHGHQG